jgi:hypothetical protein
VAELSCGMMTGIMVALIMKIQISCIWAGQLVMVMNMTNATMEEDYNESREQ